jgi:hypothetical protein
MSVDKSRLRFSRSQSTMWLPWCTIFMRFHTLKDINGDVTSVLISVPDTASFRSADEVLGWLHVNVTQAVLLKRRRRTPGVSVELEVQGLQPEQGRVFFTLTPPSKRDGDGEADVEAILSRLRERGLDAELLK